MKKRKDGKKALDNTLKPTNSSFRVFQKPLQVTLTLVGALVLNEQRSARLGLSIWGISHSTPLSEAKKKAATLLKEIGAKDALIVFPAHRQLSLLPSGKGNLATCTLKLFR